MQKTCEPYNIKIKLAGNIIDIERICREYTNRGGLCVTVMPCRFFYKGGSEDGAFVELENYPRFPKEASELYKQAEELAELLRIGACQDSYMICGPGETTWTTVREY